MRYLLLCLLLSGCGSRHREIDRLQKESELFCSCHGGLNTLLLEEGALHIACNDANEVHLHGKPRNIAIRGPVCHRIR